jgi:serine/threonine protein kinase
LEAARKLYAVVDQAKFNLGLYLVDFPGLGAVQGYARQDDLIEVRFLTVSERIMTIDDPESTWQRCVDVSRQNAQHSETPASQPIPAPTPRTAAANRPKTEQKAWLPTGWTLGKPIAEGGQGWTYKVRRNSEEDGEWFVFKRLKNADRADRFNSEIKALRALRHPGILQITEDGARDGKPYYIAEYCGNGDLSKRNLNGVTTLDKLLLFRQICSAVAAAHTAKIVHRDIKPSNILVRTDGSIAVGDFGLCLHLDAGERLTITEEAVGARYYMAPEMEDGRRDDVTPAADVYSLGKILYFLFAGRSFSREKHRDHNYDLTQPAGGQPESGIQFVYEVLDKSIAESPKSRFENASTLITAVDGVIRRIALNAHVLDLNVNQPCLYCVDGEYQQLQGSQANVQGMVLACRRCGNIQHFNPPYNGWNAWWMKR